ncbi:MAG: hypothetical protein WCS42_04865 [Verrucomicrobiota bacterium]
MKLKFSPLPRRPSGYALIIVMLFLALSLVVFGSMMGWVSSGAKVTQRNILFNSAQAAAESATEVALGTMMRDYTFQALNSASAYANLYSTIDQTTWPIKYQFSNPSMSVGTKYWTNLDSQFTGLSGFVQYCTNAITATATNAEVGVPATVQQVIQFASIPIFQYAIFYNMDLEVCPGAAMNINGHVHSNNNIWTTGSSSSELLTYSSLVDASQTLYYTRSPNDPQSYTTGNVRFTITANNPLNGVPSLAMPIGTNNNPATVRAILGIPPANMIAPIAAAYSATGTVYLYNGADLIISNWANGASSPTNMTIYYDNQFVSPCLTPILPDVVSIHTNTSTHLPDATNYVAYSWVTNTSFWDYRESDTVQAVEIDVNKFRMWLTNYVPCYPTLGGTNLSRGGRQYDLLNSSGSTSEGHGINSIYVYNGIPRTTSQLPAVRLVNGQRLPPNDLTVATPQPMYIKGDYNTTTNGTTFAMALGSTTNGCTVPASVMADAVTILSTNWSDANTFGTSLGSRNAAGTTINAACLEGIVQSVTSGGTKYYSGGVENFLRMLEDWSSASGGGKDILSYNGSIVVLFPSQYATNYWVGPGTYYNPPQRNWGFDVNFSKGQQYLPPLTPQVKETIRSSWATK